MCRPLVEEKDGLTGRLLRGRTPRWPILGSLDADVVVQHPNGRSVQVIELTPPSAPHERDDRHEHDERRQRYNNEDDAHAAPPFGKVVLHHDARTTVSELTGIRIAAMSGLMTPVTASVAPITL